MAVAVFVLLAVLSGKALAAGSGPVTVELQQNHGRDVTRASTFPVGIANTDGGTRQQYKFQRERQGKCFTYVTAGLEPGTSYSVELSFVEHDFHTGGMRRFNVYVQSALALSDLDLYSASGADSAYQVTVQSKADGRGLLPVAFRSDQAGCVDNATVSTVRVFSGAGDAVEIDASASRNVKDPPVSHYNTASQNTFEAVLGRLGSRASLDLVPQRLACRFTTLGTWTGDLSEFVFALKCGKEVRALPFTGRFPTFENISQTQKMTSQALACSSGSMPLQVTVAFRAPFYPRNEKVSGAPFFYVELSVKNGSSHSASGTFMVARPVKDEFASAGIARFSDASATGITSRTEYNYNDETVNANDAKAAGEALALPTAEAAGLDFRGATAGQFGDFSSGALWGWSSPVGYPVAGDPKNPAYTFYPRGYEGCLWTISNLASGATTTKHFILAGHTADSILSVKNSRYTDSAFRFRYNQYFNDVRAVAGYAAASRTAGDDIEGKSDFFDSTVFSDAYLLLDPSYKDSVRNMIACSFQTYLTNTWWARSSSGRNWFSVWEGTWMRFHGTVDVEYNQAWFYYEFWPDLLPTILNEWLLYPKSNEAGVYLPHDIGILDQVSGQVYDHDMPVEENLNYILLLYKYWKSTGNTAYVKSRFDYVRMLTGFLTNCDTNGNGLPDKYSQTTFDDGTPALEGGKDQSYLGLKCLAAYRAAREMALGISPQEASFAGSCQGRVELINQTLENDAWLSDHFAVCLDGSVQSADREASSIHTGNGLLYLMGAQRDIGVTATNFTRLREDIQNATARTWGTYGSRHTSYDPGRMWISSNLWRDALACYSGVTLAGASPLALSNAYWTFEQYLGRDLSGGYWDGMIYGSGAGAGGRQMRASAQGGQRSAETVPAPAGIVAERPVYFDYAGGITGGHDTVGATAPAATFYFAEGTCRPGFEPYLCIQDPGAGSASVKITYMLGDGRTRQQRLHVAAHSRSTVRVKELLGEGDDASHDFSAKVESVNGAGIIAERPMYFNYHGWTGGHDVIGATGPAPVFYFAEGSCRPGFDPFLCLQNPGASDTDVRITYMLGDGRNKVQSLKVPAHSRSTVRVRDTLGGGDDPSHDFSAKVESVGGAGIVAERPVYFNYHGAWSGGHDVVGATSPASSFYFAEGSCRPAFDPYICIQNPGATGSEVKITYMLGDGRTQEQSLAVAAHSRSTIRVADVLGHGDDAAHDFSAKVQTLNGTSIIAERPEYFDYRGWTGGHDVIGATASSGFFYFAEGTCRPGFDPYLSLQNPGPDPLDAKITYMLGDGSTREQVVRIGPHSRSTVKVRDTLGGADDSAHDFSAKVEAVNGTAATPLMSYYPRGTASLGLIDSVAGLVMDGPENSLYYQPATSPVKIPVFSRADWANADPSKRVPTLYFASASASPTITNRSLLPATVGPADVRELGDVRATGHAIDTADPAAQSATVYYNLPVASSVRRTIWGGSKCVRSLADVHQAAGKHEFQWDGKDDAGNAVDDGEYAARIDAQGDGGAAEIRPASATVYGDSSVPGLAKDWYLAEGYTGSGPRGDFEEYILVQNPGGAGARISATFMLAGGRTVHKTFEAASHSRLTISVDSIFTADEVSVRLQANVPVAVERSMFFSGRRAGHDSIGVTAPGTRWYLAEGCTTQGFDEYVLVQNPGDRDAAVTATFMTGGGSARTRGYAVPAHSRFTIHVNDVLPGQVVSTAIESDRPVVVERSQYLNNMAAGTCSIAARSLSRTWFLAEGYTGGGFQEYVLLENPGTAANQVMLFFMEPSGANTIRTYEIPARSRFSVAVGDVLPGREVSVKVQAQYPLAAERAMYWNNRSDGHVSIGAPSPDTDWYLPDGYTGGGFETWLLVQNPGDEARSVTMTFMEPSGRQTSRQYRLGPRSRFTVPADTILPASEFSTHVAADGPVIVEKAMYFNGRSGGTCSIGIRGNVTAPY